MSQKYLEMRKLIEIQILKHICAYFNSLRNSALFLKTIFSRHYSSLIAGNVCPSYRSTETPTDPCAFRSAALQSENFPVPYPGFQDLRWRINHPDGGR